MMKIEKNWETSVKTDQNKRKLAENEMKLDQNVMKPGTNRHVCRPREELMQRERVSRAIIIK